MMSMSGKVTSDVAKRRSGSVAATALIGLLLGFLALPLCSAAFTCTMPCCEGSGEPMEDHGAMPAPACGGTASECPAGSFTAADVGVLNAESEALHALPAAARRAFTEIAISSHSVYPLLLPARSNTRLHVLNDVFLI